MLLVRLTEEKISNEYKFGKIEINQSISQRIQIKNTENSTEAFVGEIKLMDSPAFKMDLSGILTLQKNESKEIQRDSLILNSIKLKRLIFNLLSYYCDMIRWDLYQILDPKNNLIYY